MDVTEQLDLKKLIITELIGVASGVILMTYCMWLQKIMLHPDELSHLKARWERIRGTEEKPDPFEHEVRRFRTEVCNWEHEELGR